MLKKLRDRLKISSWFHKSVQSYPYDEADHRQLQLPKATDFQAIPGSGVEGQVNGQRYRVGRPEWAQELKVQFPEALQRGLEQAESRGESAIVLMDARQVLAVFGLADQVREQAREAVEKLREMDVEVVIYGRCRSGCQDRCR